MTKKLENINLKYQNVREVGIQEKESNFDRLKRATDEREKGIFPTCSLMCMPI